MHRNQREFIDQLRRESEIIEITTEVDPHLELAEIHRRVVAAGGPALLFRRVKGAQLPLVTNLFGSARRVELGFGNRGQKFLERLVEVVETAVPPTLGKLWDARDVPRTLLKVGMKRRSTGPVTEIVDKAESLDQLPIITSWPEDGGPFLTWPLVYTEHPVDRRHNLGVYRMQKHGPRTLGVHWQIHKGGGYHLHEAERLQRSLPVTVFLGGPPALTASAIAPLPENVGELLLASLLIGKRLPLVENPLSDQPLVAEAEMALVGHVDPGVRMPEGPFGDHYGYYSLKHDYPVFQLDAICRRRDAVIPATVVGKPRQEDFYLGDFLQELLSPLFPLVMPAVRSLWSYGETGYHSLAAAVVKDRYPREAMVSAFRILGEGQLSLTKFLLLTDCSVDLADFKSTLTSVLERADFRRDLHVFSCTSIDTLDYTGPAVNEGSKGVLLGLGDPIRQLPTEFRGDLPSGVDRVEVYCPGCLVVEGMSFEADREAPPRIAKHPAFADWPLLVLVDDARSTVRSDARFLWTTFTRFEPAGDIYAKEVPLVRNHPAFEAPVVIDARFKPTYPAELFCDGETAEKVSRRWKEYFPSGKVEMGDSDVGHLDR